MDTEIIEKHLQWVKAIDYKYVERQPEEFDGFFEVLGMTTGAGLGIAVGTLIGGPAGGALASGLLAATLSTIGRKFDPKKRL